MRGYLRFLRRHPGWWLPPVVAYVGLLLWLANRVAGTPDSPFVYTLY